MQHPDEGTIHAWLDGELPSEEAGALESHVQSCEACAALVAEARGFIAASSRILGALDEVPANVAPPAKAPVTGEGARPELGVVRGGGGRSARRPFYRRPQFAAAAALLVVALGTLRVVRERGAAPAESAAPASQFEAPLAAAPAAAPADSVRVDAVAPAAAVARKAAPALAPGAGAVAEADAARPTSTVANAPVPGAPPAPATLADQADRARREVAASNEVAAAQPAAKSAGAVEGKRLAVAADSVTSSEQRRVAGEVQAQRRASDLSSSKVQLEQVVATGAATAAPSAPSARRCYAIPSTARTLELGLPEHFELLPTAGPVVGDRRWQQVRVVGEAAAVWYWAMEGGSVVLAQVEGGVVRQRVVLGGEVRAAVEGCAK